MTKNETKNNIKSKSIQNIELILLTKSFGHHNIMTCALML